jgi:hypothetical protein
MRIRFFGSLSLSVSLLLSSAGCGKTAVVRAPTRVVAEEPARPATLVARAAADEKETPVQAKDAPGDPEPAAFQFPKDRAGELLVKELAPSAVRPLPESPAKPRRGKVMAQLESPELPLPPTLAGHAALPPDRPRKPLLPRLVTPEALFGLALEVGLPQPKPLPVGERTKEFGPDVKTPAPLPILGQPVPDRASLADATGDASAAAAVSAAMPARSQTLPFQRLAVPDPFENYRPLRLPVPAEPTDPVTGPPRTP